MAKPKSKMDDKYLVEYVLSAAKRGDSYRNQFSETIDKSVDHYNCHKPQEWSKKPDWATKVFIPLTYKNVETATAMLVKMLLGQRGFFEIAGFQEDEEDVRDALADFIVHVLDKGHFYNVAALLIKEACITSTSFIKTLDVSKGNDFELQFIPRTFYDVLVDPSVSFYWVNSRFVIDEYEKDVSDILTSDLYTHGKEHFEDIKKGGGFSSSLSGENARRIKEKMRDISDDQTYIPVHLYEFHGKVKDPETCEDVEMVLTVANEEYLIRREEVDEEDRPYDVIRVNPNPKEFYGSGIAAHNQPIQELMNGVINLGMDNWKFSATPIVAVDFTGVNDVSSMVVEPGAVWDVKGAAVTPLKVAMPIDFMNALGVLDQISQETVGITKVAQGQNVPGSDETLGEVQIKLSRSDNRFLQMAKFIEAEFLGRFIRKIINYIIKHAPQSYVDKVLGYKEVLRDIPLQMPDGSIQQVSRKVKVKRLDLEDIRKRQKDLSLDFKPIGISRFMHKAEEQGRYKELLQGVLTNETLAQLFDVKKVAKRTMQAVGFEDVEDLMREQEQPQQQGGPGGVGRPPDFPTDPTQQQLVTPELSGDIQGGLNNAAG